MGRAGIKNGELLERAEKEFDVFITGDRNLAMQQDLKLYKIAIVVLRASSTQLHHTLPLMPKVLASMQNVRPGTVTVIS
jgi:hypothetical protein